MHTGPQSIEYAQPGSRRLPDARALRTEQHGVSLADLDARHIAATFRFPGSIWADTVELAGDFTPEPLPMTYVRDDDEWQATVVLARNQVYHYWYLLDGHERCLECDDRIEAPPAEDAAGVPVALPLLLTAPQ